MKNILSILAVALALSACGAEASKETPTDLAEIKKLLFQKKTELKSIQEEVDKLTALVEEKEGTKE
jgi:hypothetical protein